MDRIKLTKTQQAAVHLFNEKLQNASNAVNLIHEQAKAFLRDVVEELGQDPKAPWHFDDKTMELVLKEN